MNQVSKFLKNKILMGSIVVGGLLCVGAYVTNNHMQQITQYEQQIQEQQETINELQQNIQYINSELKLINNNLKYQKSIIDKTSGRLINEHVDNSTQASRGIRENYSVDTFKVMSKTSITAHELNQALEGTGLAGLGEAFVRAEINTGVNSLFLAGLAKIESGNGTSALFHEKNNLFGFQAYDASPYESGKGFDSKEECINYVANFLKDNYCSEDGCYYRGGTIADVNYYYASNPQWGNKVFSVICELENQCHN